MPNTLEHGLHNNRGDAERNTVKERVTDVEQVLWKIASPFLNSAFLASVSHEV